MKAIFLTSRKIPIVKKVTGLLCFVALSVACFATPLATFAGSVPNTVVLVKDYGSINQLVVMPGGQLGMQLQTSGVNKDNNKLVMPTATATATAVPKSCTTEDTSEKEDGIKDDTQGASEKDDSQEAQDTCDKGAVVAPPKTSSMSGSKIPAGHILSVQFGNRVVVGISLGNGQVLMPDGKIMSFK